MMRALVTTAVLSLIALGGVSVWSASREGSPVCSSDGSSCYVPSGESGSRATAAVKPSGKVLGHFDPSMSGVCRFACASRMMYDSDDLIPQPGAKNQRLTQCPVSVVVFMVDANRPRVRLGTDEYVTCCDGCAAKLRKHPRQFVRL